MYPSRAYSAAALWSRAIAVRQRQFWFVRRLASVGAPRPLLMSALSSCRRVPHDGVPEASDNIAARSPLLSGGRDEQPTVPKAFSGRLGAF